MLDGCGGVCAIESVNTIWQLPSNSDVLKISNLFYDKPGTDLQMSRRQFLTNVAFNVKEWKQ